MIVGNPEIFAIETEINRAYERTGLLALGFFVIHILGHSYGVKSSDATMLANSSDSVSRRISTRGKHRPSFPAETRAEDIASAVSHSLYIDCPDDKSFFGSNVTEFTDALYSNDLLWAPDGDEAFDDGSHILQFDIDNRVRLVGFTRSINPEYDPESLSDIWLEGEDFYDVLQKWREDFQKELATHPKLSD